MPSSRLLPSLLVSVLFTLPAAASLTPAQRTEIDHIVEKALQDTRVASASVAIVKDGQLVFARAYGNARLKPKLKATPEMAYAIGSISKQFTAAALLLLAEEGKLSLDDHVSRFLPEVPHGAEITIRQLLSHTSGYPDFWPQDYVMKSMQRSIDPKQIVKDWAGKPLDFAPGTRWEYSNTNFVIAGLVAEKVSGVPLFQFLSQRVFTPLGMKSVFDYDQKGMPKEGPRGFMHHATGPSRPALDEGRGWMFGAGELAMTASDLARWDQAVLSRSVLKPDSYRALETEVRIASGLGTNYGLGVHLGLFDNHRLISHTGEVAGFTALNAVFPDDGAAVVVLNNNDAADSTNEQIARKLYRLILEGAAPEALARAKKIFAGLQHGRIDRSLFTENANGYFDDLALKDFKQSLGRLGKPTSFTPDRKSDRGGMTYRSFKVKLRKQDFSVTTYELPDGKLEQYLVIPE
jgi:CubicO group peptidase (beta-lactamase class C family)